MSLITDEFVIKNQSPLTYESAVSMGRLICTLSVSFQRKILMSQPEVFQNALNVLGKTLDCREKIFETCISNLAKAATSEDGFGETKNWDASHLSTLGVIAAGKSLYRA